MCFVNSVKFSNLLNICQVDIEKNVSRNIQKNNITNQTLNSYKLFNQNNNI